MKKNNLSVIIQFVIVFISLNACSYAERTHDKSKKKIPDSIMLDKIMSSKLDTNLTVRNEKILVLCISNSQLFFNGVEIEKDIFHKRINSFFAEKDLDYYLYIVQIFSSNIELEQYSIFLSIIENEFNALLNDIAIEQYDRSLAELSEKEKISLPKKLLLNESELSLIDNYSIPDSINCN